MDDAWEAAAEEEDSENPPTAEELGAPKEGWEEGALAKLKPPRAAADEADEKRPPPVAAPAQHNNWNLEFGATGKQPWVSLQDFSFSFGEKSQYQGESEIEFCLG